MVSSRMPSMIERSPRAPVLRSIALRAMAPSASSARVRSIDSISNSRWYCFTSAFLGWVRMSLRDGSSRSSSVVTTGSRPTNSGMRPYFKRCGSGKPFRGADSALSPASVGYPDACDGRDMPLFCSPTALQRLFHHDGERAVAKAAEKFGTMFGVSSLGTVSIEEVGAAITTPKMFQLYFHKDRGLTNSMIERCLAANFDVLALTVDTIVGGNRERDLRTGFTSPPRLTASSLLSFALHPAWTFNYVLRERFDLPQLEGL